MSKSLKIIFYFFMTFSLLSCNTNEKEKQGMTDNNKSFQTNNSETAEKTKIIIELGDVSLTAWLENNETTRGLLELLPVTITMKELYESEKYAELPVKLSGSGAVRQGYKIGDIGYWTPGNSLVIYYKQTGEVINGLEIIGKIDGNTDIFEKSKGSVTVRISKAD